MYLIETQIRRVPLVGLILLVSFFAACAQQMANQPRYEPLEPSTVFADQRSARPLVPGTVPRSRTATAAASGALPVTEAMLKRGRERFGIYCAVCHGLAGHGDGMIPERGLSRPPSFHTEQMRAYPASHFFDVMTQGYGAMPSYATQISVDDRWAIIAYIRALQLSQHATSDDAPPEERAKLGKEGTQ